MKNMTAMFQCSAYCGFYDKKIISDDLLFDNIFDVHGGNDFLRMLRVTPRELVHFFQILKLAESNEFLSKDQVE